MSESANSSFPQPIGIDHLVLTVANPAATTLFYRRAVGAQTFVSGDGHLALAVGDHTIGLHTHGVEHAPHAARPTPGSADVRILVGGSMDRLLAHLAGQGIPVEEGPVARTGASGTILSVYVRDPDANLVQISVLR